MKFGKLQSCGSLLKKAAIVLSLLMALFAFAGINTNAYAATAAQQDPYIILITIYSQPNFQGNSMTFYGNAGPCDTIGYHVSNLANRGWNGPVLSFQPGPTCQETRLFTGTNETGDEYDNAGNTAQVGGALATAPALSLQVLQSAGTGGQTPRGLS